MTGRSKHTLDDADLIRAARERLLHEIRSAHRGASARQHVVNNIYGSGGLSDRMGAPTVGAESSGSEDPNDYFVEIKRRDVDDDSGKGWDKNVRRYRKAHDEKKTRS